MRSDRPIVRWRPECDSLRDSDCFDGGNTIDGTPMTVTLEPSAVFPLLVLFGLGVLAFRKRLLRAE